ncbi:hypothetical protein [Methanosphaera sp. BMS]|uniref:hypothetical protein n=1 Tax=Methanosphaera sp. BMS TaxID=1789762 RepID=UPI000DC1C05E|nr:hypothetical protein [Methanosphaera sp. BMS]AWX31764.1 hypothetical protein AW729_01075 [Methanosphaera sp. BMS]
MSQNNININGIVNYGMEIYTATNTQITDNNITLNGSKSMEIGYAHSLNSTATENTITINDDSTIPINSVTEEIQPENTGIKIQQDPINIELENNKIKITDTQQKDTTIHSEESVNITIKNNQLTSSTGYGDETILAPEDAIIENNIINTNITTEDVTTLTNTPTTLTAAITDGDNVINNGKVVFKINGKTVKDANGKVIYAKVSNNQVNFTYTLPSDMKAKEYNLTAVFISSDYDCLEDTKTLTVN